MNDKLTVLLIEDNSGDARLIREMLGETKGAPFELVHADRLAAGLARLAAGGINVILLDLALPDSNGSDTLIQARAHAADAPIVVLTGLDDEALGIRLMHEGAQDYLVKGQIDGNLLARTIRYAIERKQIERRLLHLAEVLRAVRNVNQLITRERDPQRLLADACSILMHTRGYCMTWIGLIEEGHSRVIPAARAGQGTDYLDQVTITWDESKAGQGPTGTAIRTRRPVLCADVTTDPRFASWRKTILQYGFASFAAAPMLCGERLFGAVNVYADKPNAFDDEEINLLAELAGDLGFALQSIENENKRGRAEEALRESEDKYRNLVERANDGITIIQDGIAQYANLRLAEMWGGSVEEVIGMPFAGYVYPDELPKVAERYKRRMAGEDIPAIYETSLRRRDGSKVYAELNAGVITYQGKPADLVIIRDITERKRAEESLRKWAQAFEHAEWGIVVSSTDGLQLEMMNPAFARIHGYTVEELTGRPVADLIAPEERGRFAERIGIASEKGHYTFESARLRKDGTIFPALVDVTVVRDEAGQVLYRIVNTQDITERKQAEEMVKRAEERYRSLFEEAPSMYVLTRREEDRPVIADCNQAFLSALGYTRGEVLARPLADFYSSASQAELLGGGYQRALEGYFQTEERQLVARDGRVIETMLQARPELDALGRVIGTRAMFVDITERKQAQEALTQERNLLRTLIDNLPDAIYVKDAAARKVLTNRADLENIGKPEAEVLGKTDWDLFPADVAARFSADDQAVLQSGQAVLNREERLVNVSGQSRWLLTSKLPLRNSEGRVIGLVGIGRDVTELVQAQEALRHSARRLALLHAIDQATLAMQPVETIAETALRGLRQLVPCQRASVILFDLTTGEGRMLAVQSDGETGLGSGKRVPTEAHLIATLRQGEARVVADLLSLSPLPPALQILQAEGLRSFVNAPLLVDGGLIGMLNLVWERPGACSPEQIEIARESADQLAIAIQQARLREQVARHTTELEQRVADRTIELRAANDKLKELDRFKSSFVSDVSHELRQPLTNIKSYLYLLDHGKPEKRAGYMATLHRETDLLQQLIEDLLHLSRIDLGKAQPVLEPLDINRLVGTLAEDRAPLVVEHGLTLQTALTPDLPPVMADTKMVTQVLTNLLANAMNYTPAGGAIVVSTAARQDGGGAGERGSGGAGERGSGGAGERGSRGDTQHAIRNTPTEWVTFSVSDTGPGIAAEEQARIFERFYRGEAAHRSRAPGTGLGLPICQELVGRLDGRIMVESQVGQGSTFTVWLPAAKDEGRMTNDG